MELYPTYSVKTTGHSMGGSLAQFAALKLIKEGIPTTTITFGPARIGDDTFAAWAPTVFPDNYRVVNHKEIAVHAMFSWKGYHHTGTEIYLSPYEEPRQCDASGEDPSCSMQWKNKPFTWSVADHIHYYDRWMLCETWWEVATPLTEEDKYKLPSEVFN